MGTEKDDAAGPEVEAPQRSAKEDGRLEAQLQLINDRLLRLKLQVAALASSSARRKRGGEDR